MGRAAHQVRGRVIMSENPTETTTELYGRMGHEFGHAFQQAGPAHPSNYNNEFELMDLKLSGQTGVFEKARRHGLPRLAAAEQVRRSQVPTAAPRVCLWAMELRPDGSSPTRRRSRSRSPGSLYYMLSVRRKILATTSTPTSTASPTKACSSSAPPRIRPWVQVKGKGGNRNVP